MDKEQKLQACKDFFTRLADNLSESYEVLGSCNCDNSVYLIPNGTEEQVTYYGKPKKSFRVSDHWNWYTSLTKNDNEHYIQCLSVDMPWAKKRPLPWKASRPVYGCQVAIIGSDGKYHCVYGEKYDRKHKKWTWVDADPADVAKLVM